MNSVYEEPHCIGIFKIYLIGKKGVGKSTFINSLYPHVTRASGANTKLTIGVDLLRYDYPIKPSDKNKFISFQIWVSNLDRRFKELEYNYLTGSKVILIMFDISDLSSLNEIDNWMEVIRKGFPKYSVPIMLLGNKADLTDHLEPAKALADSLVKKHSLMGYYDISALKSINVELTFRTMAETLLKKLS